MTRHDPGLVPPATRNLTLGLLTPHNVHDPRAFSGTPYHAARTLARAEGVDLRLLGAQHRPPGIATRLARRFKGRPAIPHPPSVSELAGLDAVVGLVASDLLDQLPAGMPYVHVTDATPGFLADAYGWDIDAAIRAREERVARKALICLYSSKMMANRAHSEIGSVRTAALPFGINLTPVHGDKKPPLRPVELLFVGADWTRKGGEIALDALTRLRAMGIPAHLTLAGRIPDHVAAQSGVTVAGFLDKTHPRHAQRLSELYARAHLLVLPTRGDCTPMVIAEAMAHGTPVLATETGGIPEMLSGTGAGHTLPMQAGAEDWAGAIRDMTRDQDAYAWMSDAALESARSRFSWDAWAEALARTVWLATRTRARAA